MLHYSKNQNIIANNSKPNNHNKTKEKEKTKVLLQTTAAKSLIWKISSAVLESTFDGVINLVNILVWISMFVCFCFIKNTNCSRNHFHSRFTSIFTRYLQIRNVYNQTRSSSETLNILNSNIVLKVVTDFRILMKK